MYCCFWVKSVIKICWMMGLAEKVWSYLGRQHKQILNKLPLNLQGAAHNYSILFLILFWANKTLIHLNIHETPMTEKEWPWLLSQSAYASPRVNENQRGQSPAELGQKHHPHLSQTFGLNQHLERLKTFWLEYHIFSSIMSKSNSCVFLNNK